MGIELLKLAKDQEAARGIIVISVFTDLERYAMLAATDFLGKPYGKEELQARALGAWKAVRENIATEKSVKEIWRFTPI